MKHELTGSLCSVVLTDTEWVTVLAALKTNQAYEEAPEIRLSILLQIAKQS